MSFEKVKLGQIAKVRNGLITKRYINEADGTAEELYKVISPKYIQSDGSIAYADIEPTKLAGLQGRCIPKDCFAKDGDIIMKLNPPFDAAVFRKSDLENDSIPYVIPSFNAIIRLEQGESNASEVNPEYIAAFLNSEVCKRLILKDVDKSRLIHALSTRNLNLMEIPLPEKNRQDEIASEFCRSRDQIVALKKLIDTISTKNNAIFESMVYE